MIVYSFLKIQYTFLHRRLPAIDLLQQEHAVSIGIRDFVSGLDLIPAHW